VPPVQVDDKPNARIEIVPIDNSHRTDLPELVGALDLELNFPPGSFILLNHTTTPITGIHVRWTYAAAKDELKQRGIVSDSYALAQLDAIVEAKGLSLITTRGCMRQALFSNRDYFPPVQNAQFGGGPDAISTNSNASIHVNLDSVIFQDGGILGPDKFQHYIQIQARYNAVREFLADVASAREAGEDLQSFLIRIRKEPKPRHYHWYASLIRNSFNPEAFLDHLKPQAPLPTFHHLGE
jgi:hypothetical protein